MRNSRKSDTKDDSFSDTTTSAAPAADAGGGTASSPPPNPGPYLVGDIVLAKHSGRFYQAKVMSSFFIRISNCFHLLASPCLGLSFFQTRVQCRGSF